MTLVQRSRFGTLLKNLTGFRGQYSVDLPPVVTPVYDVGAYDVGLDDEVAFFQTTDLNQAAVAAQFSGIGVVFNTSVPAQQVAVIDGFLIRAQTVAATWKIGIVSDALGATTVNTSLRNDFLGQRGTTGIYNATASQTANLFGFTRANAASAFTGLGWLISTQANGPDLLISLPTLQYEIQKGYAFCIESNALNFPANGSFWGHFLADQI